MKIPFIDRKVADHFDFTLLALILPIVVISVFLISEVSPSLANKQLGYIMLSIIVFVLIFLLPIRQFAWMIPFFYWIGILLLIAVYFFGVTKLGAKRWLEIPFTTLTFQPSEFFKPLFILMLGYTIHQKPPTAKGYGWKDFLKLSFYILLPFALIAGEPDLGTATLILLVGGGVLVAVGLRRKVWISLLVAISLTATFGYELLHDYQKKRIHDFLSEKPSYHVQQSMIAIGSGGITGKHKEDATQARLRFLPIATSDFIFAYHVERFGFLGAFVLISIFGFLIAHLFALTHKARGDYLTMVVITAVGIMIFLHMAVNIAMTVGLAPVVGVPLPLFSYGGSSFINFMILFAIIENLLAFRFNFLYTSALETLE